MPLEDWTALEAALQTAAEELTARRRDDSEQSWEEVLGRLTVAAAHRVPGAAYAGLTMRTSDGGLESRAPSHAAIVELDRAQADLGEGPCVDALQPGGSATVHVADFAAEPRWPRFAGFAVDAGVSSLLSYAMAPHGAPPGAMNVYAIAPGAFDDASARAVAAAFASQAAVAIYGRARIANLGSALASRDAIGQAKGILMERHALDETQAFELLVRSSQDTNIKLVDVARWLTDDTARQRGRRTTGSGAS